MPDELPETLENLENPKYARVVIRTRVLATREQILATFSFAHLGFPRVSGSSSSMRNKSNKDSGVENGLSEDRDILRALAHFITSKYYMKAIYKGPIVSIYCDINTLEGV
jgi:hypothetical protein